MLYSLISAWDRFSSVQTASAHCDIPCKIYDPSAAQISVLTMIRMIDLIEEINQKHALTLGDQTQLIRLTGEKEAHGIKLKDEVRVIWGDYFKKPQLDLFPETHTLVHNIMLQASKTKQGISRDDALTLLDLVNQFADIFWQTKGFETYKAVCPYPPSEAVIYPKLAVV